MKIQIKSSIKHFGFTFLVLIVLLVWVAGCTTPSPGPLAGWHFYSRTKVSQSITDDYQEFIQNLPPKQRWYIGDVSFFEDGTGQHAVNIEIFEYHQNASWQYAIIYDKENKRIKVTKYGHRRYQS